MGYFFLIRLAPILVPPLLFWVWIRRLGREDWDPRPFARFFLSGAIAILIWAIVGHYLGRWLGGEGTTPLAALRQGFLMAAIPEEIIRALLLLWWIRKQRGFATPTWIVSVAVALAMGQVALENLIYFYFNHRDAEERLETWLFRVVFCVPTMGFYGFTTGVMAAWGRLRRRNWTVCLAAGTVIAIVGHGLYDSALYIVANHAAWEPYAPYAAIPVAAIAMVICYVPIRRRYNEIYTVAT